MYDKLFDAVSQIVKTYGVTIFDDPKFWHILTYTYSFGSDYSPKDTFKECILRGYVSQIVALRTNRKKTISKIEYFSKDAKKNGLNEGETIASLFSIAIGIGSCSKKDYYNFSQTTSYPPQPKKGNKKQGNSGNNAISFGIVLMVFVGIIILYGSSLLYAAFLSGGWYMFFVMFIIGLFQLAFCSWCMNTLSGEYFQWNALLKQNAESCYIPIISGFLMNDLFPFLLCNRSIRAAFYRHFEDWDYPSRFDLPNYIDIYSYEAPGGLSIFLTIIVLFAVGACGWYIISPTFDFRRLRYNFNKRMLVVVTGVIVALYLCLFTFPMWQRYSAKNRYFHNKEMIHSMERIQISTNDSLRKERIKSKPDLSFKGIRLGISYDTAIEYARAFSDDNSISIDAFKINVRRPDYIIADILDEQDVPNSMGRSDQNEVASMEYVYSLEKNDVIFRGDKFLCRTTLDNQEVSCDVLSLNGRCFCIIIKPYGHSWSSFNDFENLLKLYTSKYGEPETYHNFPHDYRYEYQSDDNTTKYLWAFQNGMIRLTRSNIVYVSAEFISQAKSDYNRNESEYLQAVQHYNDSIQRERIRRDSISKENDRQDSLRRKYNHENAINEI